MWPRLFLTAAIITTVVGGVSAQTGTADGVVALARGDYQRAAEILKPIAEDLRTNDTAAQFFMAGLYETGRGVPADPLRACALYMRAASNHDNPFGQEASPCLLRRRQRTRPGVRPGMSASRQHRVRPWVRAGHVRPRAWTLD